VTRNTLDPKHPPPTLEESYAVACTTSDLGLPHGEGAGAQGILAAAAWTEVHLGSALRRMRRQWETEKPTRKVARTKQQLMSAGLTKDQARAKHNRERIEFAKTYYRERTAVIRGLREFPQAREHLMLHAAALGMEDADLKAFTILQQWLDCRDEPSFDEDGRRLLQYLDDCAARARHALVQGMRGHTKHERTEED
jgi:hypothetical protein